MRVALDTGGTFTDCVFLRGGRLEILKIPSTPRNPADAIRIALERIAGESPDGADGEPLEVLCGTTVGTNALLERRGGRVALVTTAGFEDVLEIGRQARPKLYELMGARPAPLVPSERRFGVRERVGADGRVLLRPSKAEIARIVRGVRGSRADAVAVCLLFSFLRPEHERLLAEKLRAAGMDVSVSHEILPEFREFERTATTVLNAYLVPVMSRYLSDIEKHAAAAARHGAENSRGRGSRPRARAGDAVERRNSFGAGGGEGAGADDTFRVLRAACWGRSRWRSAPAIRGRSASIWAARRRTYR